ncbi:hypothetical protein M1N92_04755 [Dehalococcoidia bacterium]|nr:hypothetical protein [Dehalococcoidia bacterium]
MIQSKSNTMKQSKVDAFKKIAEKRTMRVLDSLRLLGQCANRRSYEYTDAQVQKIFGEIRRAVRDAEHRFKNDRKNIKFKL